VAEPLSDERLKEIEARTAAASPAPWWHVTEMLWVGGEFAEGAHQVENPDGAGAIASTVRTPDGPRGLAPADAGFIAHARQDVPDLLAAVRRLREELRRAEDRLDHFEKIVDDADGVALAHFEVVGNPMPRGSNVGEGLFVLADELKRLREEIASQKERADRAEAERDRLRTHLATLHHLLVGPLTDGTDANLPALCTGIRAALDRHDDACRVVAEHLLAAGRFAGREPEATLGVLEGELRRMREAVESKGGGA